MCARVYALLLSATHRYLMLHLNLWIYADIAILPPASANTTIDAFNHPRGC